MSTLGAAARHEHGKFDRPRNTDDRHIDDLGRANIAGTEHCEARTQGAGIAAEMRIGGIEMRQRCSLDECERYGERRDANQTTRTSAPHAANLNEISAAAKLITRSGRRILQQQNARARVADGNVIVLVQHVDLVGQSAAHDQPMDDLETLGAGLLHDFGR